MNEFNPGLSGHWEKLTANHLPGRTIGQINGGDTKGAKQFRWT